MIDVKWDLGGFSVFYSGKFPTFEEVEKNIASLSGISNFSGLEGDWFLVEKKDKVLGFMLLNIPSSIEQLKSSLVDLSGLHEISIDDFIGLAEFAFYGTPSAYFCESTNQIFILDRNDIKYKVMIGADFHLLLNSQKKRCGFVMDNAIKNIVSENEYSDDIVFHDLLMQMLGFCDSGKYKLMDDEDQACLQQLIALEKQCVDMGNKDGRIFHILEFVRNAKYSFYDIEE
ncbi:hypothetical protein N0A02_00190 [Paraburkholderia acidicola]|uniref:Uncharacterized protein n=1 Tax=Paraburkholderia acidicola TaxID=1912599 RepID=A0ABV1LET2_9BURK